MSPFFTKAFAFLLLSLFSIVLAQDDGYIGYTLEQRGDPDSTVYDTVDTDTSTGGVVLPAEPDVYLNASVHVGEIDIEVDNITAKVNLDAKVLNLLHFTAGVDVSIDRVKLTIQNVTAKVTLEARLENVVAMVDDVLSSIDLNPIVATLGNVIDNVVTNVTDTLGGSGTSSAAASTSTAATAKRSVGSLDYNMAHNILYSINNYAGDTHTNRVLGKNGTIWDVSLDNDGTETSRKNVGYYSRDMTYTGHNRTVIFNGETEYELGYKYAPYVGLDIYAHIIMTPAGTVISTRIVSETEGGGTSTISDDSDPELRK